MKILIEIGTKHTRIRSNEAGTEFQISEFMMGLENVAYNVRKNYQISLDKAYILIFGSDEKEDIIHSVGSDFNTSNLNQIIDNRIMEILELSKVEITKQGIDLDASDDVIFSGDIMKYHNFSNLVQQVYPSYSA